MTMTETTLTCPDWCRTDHAAERAEQKRMDAETHAHIRAADPTWTGTQSIHTDFTHQREVGELQVRTGHNAAPGMLRMILEDSNDGTGPVLTSIAPQGWSQDLTAPEAAGFADLLQIGRRMLAEADGTMARRWADVAAAGAKFDALVPTVIPPCPAWCTEPTGHEYDGTEVDGETFLRYHSTDTGPGCMAALTQLESNRAGVVTLSSLEIDTGSFVAPGRALTVEQARRLSADLLVLNAQLEQVSARA